MRKPDDRGQILLVGLFFFLLSLLFTYPIWTRPNSFLNEVLDTALNTWILAWDAHAMLHKPLELFNANIFFPHERTLAFSENMLASAIPVAPLNWLGMPVLAYNVVLFSSFVLSGVGATLWVRAISGSLFAGLVAGFIWAFAPIKFDHLAHLQLLTSQWIPFTLLAIVRYFDSGERRYAVAAGGLFGLQYLSGIYMGLMFLPFAVIYAALLCVHRRAAGHEIAGRRLLRDGVVALAIAAVLILPVSLPYMWVNEAEGFERSLSDVGGTPIHAYVSPSRHNRAPHMQALASRYNLPEANFFPGVLPSLLFVGGLFLLMSTVLRQRSTRDGSESPGQPWSLGEIGSSAERWTLRATGFAGVLLGLLHVAGFLVAHWEAHPPALDAVLSLCQRLNPSLWLAVVASIAAVLWLRSRATETSTTAHYTILGFMLLISYLLAFGPTVSTWSGDLGMGPYRILYELLPPYRSIRVAGRFALLWTLFFSAMVGLSLAVGRELLRARVASDTWRRGRVAIVAVLSATLLFEYRVWPLPAVEVSPSASAVDVWLAEQPEGTSVLHMPLAPGDHPPHAARYMLDSTLHFLPLVNGYSGFFPSSWSALAATEDFGGRFFELLRRRIPVDYLVVHGDEYGEEFEGETAPRLLADRRNLSLVERIGDALVFRVERDRDIGVEVARRFSRSQLRDVTAIAFQARFDTSTSTPGRSPMLWAGWGDAPPQRLDVGVDWRSFRFAAPGASDWDADGTATLSLTSGYVLEESLRGPEIGSSGRRLRADVLLDVQGRGIFLAINDAWRHSMTRFGIQAYKLGEFGTRLLGHATFPANDFQEDDLNVFLESTSADEVVALGIHHPEGLRLSPSLASALRALGSSLQAVDTVQRYALIGAPGLVPGVAAEHVGHGRVHAGVGEAGHRQAVSMRRIRLLSRQRRDR